MTIVLNGTTGISGVDGSASTPSFQGNDTNTGIFYPAADTIAFAEGGTEVMRIDSSGNVGIGTTNPSPKITVARTASTSVTNASYYLGLGGTENLLDSKRLIGMGYSSGSSEEYPTAMGYVETSNAGFTNGAIAFYTRSVTTNTAPSERMRIDSSGGLILAGSTAQKATGTTWSNPSDQRLKDNIRDYTKGTTELMQVRVREWEYNGKGNTTEGMKGLGVVADEVMTVLPDTVETYNAKLNADDEETTAIKKFDATEITWLLVKTVQEQQTIINDLKARIETLEASNV